MGVSKLYTHILKKNARVEWKKKIKEGKVVKRNRVPFGRFFKEYVKNHGGNLDVVEASGEQEDFNFEDHITVHDIDEESVEE